MLRRSSHVIAFEPHPELAKTIQSKFLYQRVLVYQYALSNQECQVNLRIPVLEGSELIALSSIENKNTLNKLPTKTIEVDCKRLDDFVFNDVGFIKIDIEGHELAVLQGAENTITKSHPNFLIEVEERHREGAIESVQKFFSDKGYQGFFIFGRQLLPLEDFQLSLHQNPENINIDRIVAGSQYANNFVFTKSESLIKRLPKHL
jgi:FkbM family methyltransferase